MTSRASEECSGALNPSGASESSGSNGEQGLVHERERTVLVVPEAGACLCRGNGWVVVHDGPHRPQNSESDLNELGLRWLPATRDSMKGG